MYWYPFLKEKHVIYVLYLIIKWLWYVIRDYGNLLTCFEIDITEQTSVCVLACVITPTAHFPAPCVARYDQIWSKLAGKQRATVLQASKLDQQR